MYKSQCDSSPWADPLWRGEYLRWSIWESLQDLSLIHIYSNDAEEEEKKEAKETAAADKKVGVFLPSSADDPRWSADGETLQNTLEDDGYDAEIFWADEDLSLIHI